MKTLKVKPAAGLQVRDNVTGKHIAKNGAEVIASPYWHKRLRDSDVVEMKDTEFKAMQAAEKKAITTAKKHAEVETKQTS